MISRHRSNYWSCSKFADFIRGTKKPGAATSAEWCNWEKEATKAHKVRFWIAEEFLDFIQNTIMFPVDLFYSVRFYIKNRFIDRSNSLTAHPNDIKPGSWQDVGYRFLPCLFNELVDFVEIECAHKMVWNKEEQKKYNYKNKWFSKWRSAEAGIDFLKFQDNEKHNEIIALYNWWKNEYPNRLDPYIESGWTDYCSNNREKGLFVFENTDRKTTTKILKKLDKLQKAQNKEEEEYMIRLIKVRENLWT